MAYKCRLFLICLFFMCTPVYAGSYTPLAEQCDGFPKLPIVTVENTCVGLLVQKSSTITFKMPRTALETADGKLLVVDMGGWAANKGTLWLVDYRAKSPTAIALLSNLNGPHKILVGPRGKFYLGEAHRIVRFQLQDSKVSHLETIVDELPVSERYLHPLKNFIFDQKNNLIVNIGSSSDRCNKDVSMEDCTHGVEAGLRLYTYDSSNDQWDKHFSVIASGLRNSMALAVDTSGTIIQAENSIDLTSAEEPYEELNIIEGNGFYGWPLCYDRQASMDESKTSCGIENYHEPWSLIPPHAAPLDALYYRHKKLTMLNNKLLLTWHGYRLVGHRLVSYDIDDKGRPLRKNEATFWSDPVKRGDDFKQLPFVAKGGVGLVAQPTEIISHWNEIEGVRPRGAPSGMSIMNDGSLLIVDDKNPAVLRLSTGVAYQDVADSGGNIAVTKATNTKTITLPENVQSILLNHCSKCHDQLKTNPDSFLDNEHWLQKTQNKTRMEQKLFDDKVRPMPPDGSLSPEERQQLKTWLTTLH